MNLTFLDSSYEWDHAVFFTFTFYVDNFYNLDTLYQHNKDTRHIGAIPWPVKHMHKSVAFHWDPRKLSFFVKSRLSGNVIGRIYFSINWPRFVQVATKKPNSLESFWFEERWFTNEISAQLSSRLTICTASGACTWCVCRHIHILIKISFFLLIVSIQ